MNLRWIARKRVRNGVGAGLVVGTVMAFGSLLGADPVADPSPNWVISANDQTSGYQQGPMFVRPDAKPGTLTILDFSQSPPKGSSIDSVPVSVIGPPTNLVVTPDGTSILVASAMRVDPEDATRLTPDNQVTWIQRDGDTWNIAGRVETGHQPSGMSLDPNGKQVYVALRAEGKIAVISLSGSRPELSTTKTVSAPEDSLSHVAVSPDGETLLTTLHEAGKVLILSRELSTRQTLEIPGGPYAITFLPDGTSALVACTRTASVHLLQETNGIWSADRTLSVGHIPEGIAVSPDGRWIAVPCFEGANAKPGDANEGEPATIHLFSRQPNGELSPQQKLTLRGIPQGAAFSPCGKYLVAGQFGEHNLAVFALEDDEWTPAVPPIPIDGESAAIISN